MAQPEPVSMRLSYEQLRRTLARFEYFRHWTEEQVRECSVLARVVQYAPQQTIPLEQPLPCAFLVLSGQCQILQYLPVVVCPEADILEDDIEANRSPVTSTSPPSDLLDDVHHWHDTFEARIAMVSSTPPAGPSATDSGIAYVQTPPPEQRVVHHLLDVGTFRCGAVFGLGECHRQRSVVARCRTQCLLIPRCWLLLRRQNVANTWQRLRLYLGCSLPTRDELFRWLRRERAWLRYRQRLIQDAPKHPTNRTLPADVPVICRLAESMLPAPPKPARLEMSSQSFRPSRLDIIRTPENAQREP